MRSIVLAAVLALWCAAAHAQLVATPVDVATVSMTTLGQPRTVTDTLCVSDGRDLVCDRGAQLLANGVISTTGLTVNGVSITGLASFASPTNVPAFVAYRYAGANQTVPTNTPTKLDLQHVAFDTFNNYDATNSRFKPTIAGFYLFEANTFCPDAANWCQIRLYKNGVTQMIESGSYSGQGLPHTTKLEYMDGINDYVEAWVYNGGGVTIGGAFIHTYFAGTLVASGNGLISGSTALGDRITSGTASGVVAMAGGTVSFTTGGTSGTAYLDTVGRFVGAGVSTTGPISGTGGYFSNRVGIGTPTPSAQMGVSGTVNASGFIQAGVGDASGTQAAGYITMVPGDSANAGYLGVYTSVTTRVGYVGSGNHAWGFTVAADGQAPLRLVTSNTERLRVSANGDIGIGTSNPSTRLDVSGTVRIGNGGETCDAGRSGAIRYNSPTTTLELCTGSGWQPMGVGIPAGTISAFASTTCPVGWSEYTAARGRFLRGIDNGAGNDPDGTRAPGNAQIDMFKAHSHGVTSWLNAGSTSSGQLPANAGAFANVFTNGDGSVINGPSNWAIQNAGGAETRPKNVAVTFCQFNGTSNGWNNPLSGGSTTAAGSTGQLQYNTGNAFDASAGLTWTNASSLLGVEAPFPPPVSRWVARRFSRSWPVPPPRRATVSPPAPRPWW